MCGKLFKTTQADGDCGPKSLLMAHLVRLLLLFVSAALVGASCTVPHRQAAPSDPSPTTPVVGRTDSASVAPEGSPVRPVAVSSVGPTGAPSRGPRVKPYRVLVMQQYWAFAPDTVHYAHHGEMEVLVDDAYAVQVVSLPSSPDVRPHDATVSSNIKLLSVRELPGRGGWVDLGVVIAPAARARKDDVLIYDVAWQQARVPYLHEQGATHRLLSLSGATAFVDNPRTQYVFAIPGNCTNISVYDMKPFRQREVGGWKLYEYDSTGLTRHTIHLGFDFNGAPAAPPPPASEVFAGLPRQ